MGIYYKTSLIKKIEINRRRRDLKPKLLGRGLAARHKGCGRISSYRERKEVMSLILLIILIILWLLGVI